MEDQRCNLCELKLTCKYVDNEDDLCPERDNIMQCERCLCDMTIETAYRRGDLYFCDACHDE